MECAPGGGQIAGWELTGVAGLSEDESHGQTPLSQDRIQAADRSRVYPTVHYTGRTPNQGSKLDFSTWAIGKPIRAAALASFPVAARIASLRTMENERDPLEFLTAVMESPAALPALCVHAAAILMPFKYSRSAVRAISKPVEIPVSQSIQDANETSRACGRQIRRPG